MGAKPEEDLKVPETEEELDGLERKIINLIVERIPSIDPREVSSIIELIDRDQTLRKMVGLLLGVKVKRAEKKSLSFYSFLKLYAIEEMSRNLQIY